MPVIPTFRRVRQENPEFKASLGYMVKPRKEGRKGGREGGRKEGDR
jgi:hypothetical protein